jgi:hypothetical protein
MPPISRESGLRELFIAGRYMYQQDVALEKRIKGYQQRKEISSCMTMEATVAAST